MNNVFRKYSDQKGFTLVELVVYVAVTSLLLSGVILTAVGAVGARSKTLAQHEVNYNSRFVLEKITQEIRRSSSINTGSSTFGSHPGVLSLEMDDAAEDPTLIDVSGGVLRITRGAGLPVNITTDKVEVTNFDLTNLSIGSKVKNVQIQLTVDHNNPGNRQEFSATSSVQTSVAIRKKNL